MLSESQMIAKMKVLVGFVLAVLGCSLTEGRLVPDCELWGELKDATANLTNGNNLVAKLVCQAEQASDLNTDVVKKWTGKKVSHSEKQAKDHHGREDNHGGNNDNQLSSRPSRRRGRRDDKGHSLQTRPLPPANSAQNCTSADCEAEPPSGLNNHQESHEKKDGHPKDRKSHGRRRRHSKGPSSSNRRRAQKCKFYGIFQLSNCQACNDRVTKTRNVCGIPCSNLLDDDISDDISCLMNLLKILGKHDDYHSGENLGEQGGVIGTISDDKCEHEKDCVYIAKC